jgi:DNA-directed RNA polymerase specialized sigma subunit
MSESDIARRLCISKTHVSRLQRHAMAKLMISLGGCVPS